MQTITDLLTPLSAAAIRAAMVSQLVTFGIRADLWRPGGTASTILTVVSSQFANFQALIVQAVASFFLPTATGGWLSLLAYYVYGVTRPPATFASGPLTLTNSGGGSFSYDSGQATFLDSTTGATYTNVDAVSLGPVSIQTVNVQAVNPGSASSAAPGQIDTAVTVMLGVTVSNAAAIVGVDALGDVALQQLCLDKLGTESVRGPRNAYAFAVSVALNATTGAPVNINRSSVSVSSHTGTVTVYCASPSGPALASDLLGVQSSIEMGVPGLSPPFSGCRPDAVTVAVASATGIAYAAALTVWARSAAGLSAATVAAAAQAAISSLIASYPIGGLATDTAMGLFGAAVVGVIQASSSAVFDVDGAVDLPLIAGEVATNKTTVSVRLV